MTKSKVLFWDWNGTLVDDVAVCHALYSVEAQIYNLKPYTLEEYRKAFHFPVYSFYLSAGLPDDKELYAQLAHHFGVHYKEMWQQVPLHVEAEETLRYFHQKGWQQYVISAYEQEALRTMVHEKGISRYFIDIVGVMDVLAGSKSYLLSEVLMKYDISCQEMLFIGDTLHDEEVALASNVPVVLIASGHMSYQRLAEAASPTTPVFQTLGEFHLWASNYLE